MATTTPLPTTTTIDNYAARHRRVLGEDHVLPYVALEWDHAVGRPAMRWLVVRCADIRSKCGGPQSLAPRADVAYFVHPDTAEADARIFAHQKNAATPWPVDASTEGTDAAVMVPAGDVPQEKLPGVATATGDLVKHCVFEWDHLLLAGAPLRWAVLEWQGAEAVAVAPDVAHARTDVAYFLDPTTAEADARLFAAARDRR